MNDKIKLVKLITGEYLLGEIQDPPAFNINTITSPQPLKSAKATLALKNVISIQAMRQPGNQEPTIGFTMWVPFTEDEIFDINYDHVLTIVTPMEEFVKQYKQMFSGLVLPSTPNKLIMPRK